jgi:tetratricopeptide (TPR) repeat protein
MGGRPAYIKWFISGVQAGQRPEELLQKNELFLDFCMSNVHRYLSENARMVLRCLQVLPGPRTQAEVAYVTSFNAEITQTAILELLTTNFVQMKTQSDADEIGSSYELTEFGRGYLDKQHPVSSEQRLLFQQRHRALRDLGRVLKEENVASPYDPLTLNVGNPGEFSAARLLRDSIRLAQDLKYDRALNLCAEAKRLAPTYFETHRVEALIYTWRGDSFSARNSYERAIELANENAPLNYFTVRSCWMRASTLKLV